MNFDDNLAYCIPEGWHLTHLIFLDPDWQVNLCDGEWVVSATGETAGEALLEASERTLDETKWLGRLAYLPSLANRNRSEPIASGLLSQLGLLRPKSPLNRRL